MIRLLLSLLLTIALIIAALSVPESWQRGIVVVALIVWVNFGVKP